MISFKGDYSEGGHERIMEALCRTNREQTAVYGEDVYTDRAKTLIRKKLECSDCEIQFLVGGTQTNQVAIAHMLRPHQAVIAAATGHISVHETGAIEATGHKVIEVAAKNGKLTPRNIETALVEHTDFHMVQPKLVYISNSTEIGTIYHKDELVALRRVCDANDLYLYLDGARLASALTSIENDLRFPDYARLTDAFYIGGTKNGALFGEALIIINDQLKADIRYTIKRQGALLAKGRLLGIQFEALFENGLYEELGAYANQLAQKLKKGIEAYGYSFMVDSNSNQQFPILPDVLVRHLSKKYEFNVMGKFSEGVTAVRFVTSWATKEDDVQGLLADLSYGVKG